jgi:tetratricopeptide (TPR) repeat protein
VLSNWVAAEVAIAKRDFAAAGLHVDALLALSPETPAFHRLKARWLTLVGRGKERRAVLEEALRHGPNDPDTLADLAELCAERGETADALRYADQALRIAPESHAALVAMGVAQLRAGNVDAAREHAILALRADATDPQALRLIASIKMRSNLALGLWWRYATWIEKIGPTRSVVVLLFAFVVYRLVVIAATGAGAEGAAAGVQVAWLAIVAYSFIGPTLFRRSLERELATVKLERF